MCVNCLYRQHERYVRNFLVNVPILTSPQTVSLSNVNSAKVTFCDDRPSQFCAPQSPTAQPEPVPLHSDRPQTLPDQGAATFRAKDSFFDSPGGAVRLRGFLVVRSMPVIAGYMTWSQLFSISRRRSDPQVNVTKLTTIIQYSKFLRFIAVIVKK